MFLGALTILRGLPDYIKRFIADRKHYDFPVGKYVEIPPADSLCPVEDSLSQNGGKNGIAYAKKDENSAHDSDLDLDLDLDSSGGGRSDYSDPPKGKNQVPEEPPPPPPLKIIKTAAARAGFIIDDDIARRFLAAGLDPAWFTGPHDFLAFTAGKVRAKYPKEPPDRQRDLFISAIAWDNLREEYPGWRDGQEREAREREKARVKNLAPARCECGAELHGSRRCPACGRIAEFDEATWGFVFHAPPAEAGLSGMFRDEIRSRAGAEGKTPEKPP
jgi:hypothetical protein